MADFETLVLDITDGLATIRLNRPERLNALSDALKSELLAAIRQIAKPGSGARALLITGEGRAFCSGADLAEGGISADRDMGANLIATYHPILLELAALEMPVISAVNGVAAGAGMSIAISADIVIAARSAYFLQAFVNIGLVPDAGSTFLLPRLVGTARARAMMMLGERLPADKALDWGLVYDVVDDDKLMETAMALAQRLANGPTLALSGIRKLIADSHDNSYSEQLTLEAMEQRKAGRSADCIEGVMAFLEKRDARFKGA
ncbi:enoyl-CoA hydratase-related protein [Kordiimonas aestuarii]|uniref:enoyl-CoA hydratase-related protein n=1 Tax=Kordiimonas aestuarii TaxID=1005925 RepID=UPI0021D086F5|nr:enoyl-CoA hydratase-related protein [Kordiimonas aestuarii]